MESFLLRNSLELSTFSRWRKSSIHSPFETFPIDVQFQACNNHLCPFPIYGPAPPRRLHKDRIGFAYRFNAPLLLVVTRHRREHYALRLASFPGPDHTVTAWQTALFAHRGGALMRDRCPVWAWDYVSAWSRCGYIINHHLWRGRRINKLASNPWVNLLITAIFLGFALSLLSACSLSSSQLES